MEWDKLVDAGISLFLGFLGGFATLVTMRNDIQTLKQQVRENREDHDKMHADNRRDREAMQQLLQTELREIRQSQERHYMNLVAMLKDSRH